MTERYDVKTPLARLAFTRGLFELQTNKSGKKQWTCTLLFPKSADLSALHEAAKNAAVEEWGDKAIQLIKDGVIKSPFLDGDGKQGRSKQTGEPHEGFPGHTFIRVTSGADYRPKVVDRKKNPITDKNELYSGCYGYAVINPFCWENAENGKGITFGISLVQFAKDGENLGGSGGADPDKWLEEIADEGDAPEATKTGKGAGGLFA